MVRARSFFFALLALLTLARVGSAQECPESARELVARCVKDSDAPLSLVRCPENVIVVHAGGAADVDIEIAPASPRSFRKVGDLGLSPIGQFADWSKEREARRAALDALEKCVGSGPALRFREQHRSWPPLPVPLLLAVGSMIVCLLSLRRGIGALAGVGAWAVVFALRWAALSPAFFHQNGHGPAWIGAALTDGAWAYGPGYRELLSAIARAGGTSPERGVFFATAALGATIPLSAYLGARGVGASRALAIALGAALAVDPVLVRIGASESYFGVGAALLFAAAALVAWSSARPRRRTLWLGIFAAGALVAQAARVHPVCWLPAALLPAVALLGPGSLRRRAGIALRVGAGIAAVVVLLAGPSLLAVLRGSLGAQWVPHAGPRTDVLGELLPIVVAALVIGAAARRRGLVIAAVALAALVLPRVFDLLSAPNPAVDAAALHLYWPVLSLAVVAWIVRVRRQPQLSRLPRWAPAAGLAAAGVVHALATWRPMTTLPTDALEQRFALRWRAALPRDARIVYLRQAGQRVLTLPLYDGVTATPLPVGEQEDVALPQLSGDVYYYRSSLCAVPEGADRCRKFESGAALATVAERELPARASMRWSPLPGPTVRVGLYRVTKGKLAP